MPPPPSLPTPDSAMPATHLWILMGPSGAGKSRIGKHLRDTLGLTFIEGDDFLTPEDKHRLATTPTPSSLTPLITAALTTALHAPTPSGVAVACSALRLADRHAWRRAVQAANSSSPSHNPATSRDPITLSRDPPPPHIHLHFLYLQISESLARRTVAVRQARDAHFMPAAAVRGQFAVLEPPGPGEGADCVVLFSEETGELMGMAGRCVGGFMGVLPRMSGG